MEGARRPTRIGDFGEDVLVSMFMYSILSIFISAFLLDLDSNSTSVLLESVITILGYSGIVCFLIPILYLILRVSLSELSEKLEGDFEKKHLFH